MAIFNMTAPQVVPSDVFGYEVKTDEGYGRETFTITVGASPVRVGTILVVNYVTGTATQLTQANLATLPATARLGVFVGRDLKTNPATAQDFDRLTMTTTGKGVAIVKGDGRGTLKKGYLDLAGTQYYALTTAQQAQLDDIFTNDNRFKMVEQQYTSAV